MEPMVGIEPTTSALRKHCSTTELHWLGAGNGNRTRLPCLGSMCNNHYTIPAYVYDIGGKARTCVESCGETIQPTRRFDKWSVE